MHNEEILDFSFHQCIHIGKDELDVASRIRSKIEKLVQILGQKKKAMPIYKMSIPLEDLSIGHEVEQGGLHSFGPGQGLVGSCDHSNESLDSIKGKEFYD